jgi:hypothetical protein
MLREELIAEFETIRRETGFSELTLGIYACKSPYFLKGLKSGAVMVRTVERFQAYAKRWREGKERGHVYLSRNAQFGATPMARSKPPNACPGRDGAQNPSVRASNPSDEIKGVRAWMRNLFKR